MILPLLLALGAIALGTALGLLRPERSRSVRAAQVLALLAAAVVGLGHLLPEALHSLGAPALAAFALPLVLSAGLAWASPDTGRDAIGVEIGYAALVVHRLIDGVLLGTYGGLVHPAGEHAGMLLALTLHAVPVSAAIALRFARSDGIGTALGRATGLAAGSVAGVALATQVPLDVAESIDPWATAVIAGLLVYLAWHEGLALYRSV